MCYNNGVESTLCYFIENHRGEFMESLYGVRINLNNKCIELPDGSTATPKEAIAWLKKQEEESDE